MDITHEDLYSQISLITDIANSAIEFFNRDLLPEKRRNGVRIHFSDLPSKEDVLHLSYGTFPSEKSNKYFDFSRNKSKFVCMDGMLTSDIKIDQSDPLPKGGVQGFHYGIGSSGQEPQDDEALSFAITIIIEKRLKLIAGKEFRDEHLLILKRELCDAGPNKNRINALMDYLLYEAKIIAKMNTFS